MNKRLRKQQSTIHSYPKFSKRTALATAISAALAAGSVPVQAQELEEVIVTATRRAQSVQEIPYNISVLGAGDLAEGRVFSLGDLSRAVAGISYIDQGPVSRANNNNFMLRGINVQSASNNAQAALVSGPAVSTYLGETPIFFAMSLKDIERVEVLRGPQGTLYGASSLGGTVRFIPKLPNFDGFTMDFDSSVSLTEDSDDMSYSADGVVNIPIIDDSLAVRIAAGYTRDGGFVDAVGRPVRQGGPFSAPVLRVPGDPFSGMTIGPREEDVNKADAYYVRVSALWQPTEKIDVNVRYQHDETDQDEPQVVNPGVGPLTVDLLSAQVPGSPAQDTRALFFGPYPNSSTTFPATGDNEHLQTSPAPYESSVDSIALDINIDVGFATLTSATSYYNIEEVFISDFSGGVEVSEVPDNSLAYYYNFFPRLTDRSDQTDDHYGFSQEVRIVSDWDKRWNFVLGGFYQKTKTKENITEFHPGLSAYDIATFYYGFNNVNFPDFIFQWDRTYDFKDIAAFGELSYQVTDQWQITGGFRAFSQELTVDFRQIFPFCGPYCAEDLTSPIGQTIVPTNKSKVDDQIFKVNTSYDVSDDMMVFFTWSEGFRRGGSNAVPIAGNFASLPQYLTFQPDQVTNYEAGIKGRLFNGKLNYSMAGYLIQWNDFQFDTFSASFLPVVVNGDKAESTGVEIELSGRFSDALSYNFGYSYTDSTAARDFLAEDLPSGGGPLVPLAQIFDGDPMPGVPEHSLAMGLDYKHPFPFASGLELNWHIDGSFRDETQSAFNPGSANFYTMDSFWIWNGSVTLDAEKWSLGLFVRNLGNEEGITGGSGERLFGTRAQHFFVSRPRTVGLSFSYHYF